MGEVVACREVKSSIAILRNGASDGTCKGGGQRIPIFKIAGLGSGSMRAQAYRIHRIDGRTSWEKFLHDHVVALHCRAVEGAPAILSAAHAHHSRL